jgi:RES domain-containing protein
MVVYRIGKTKYANDLVGIGAEMNGGRWNRVGTACLYAAASRALAVLEYSVNTNIDLIPRALSITVIDVDNAAVLTLSASQLPGNWQEFPFPASTQNFGTEILKTAKSALIKIPSAVVPDEFNYIINPSHVDHRLIRIVSISDFVYDLRIKTT